MFKLPDLFSESPSSQLLCPFLTYYHLFWTRLLSGTKRCSNLIGNFFCPSHGVEPFLQGTKFHLVVFRKQLLYAWLLGCHCSHAFSFVFISVIHIYTSVSLFNCLFPNSASFDISWLSPQMQMFFSLCWVLTPDTWPLQHCLPHGCHSNLLGLLLPALGYISSILVRKFTVLNSTSWL